MTERKIYCEILEGVTFSDRCLWRLSKVIEGNKACEDCILRELQILKRCGVREDKIKPLKKTETDHKKKLRAPRSIRRDTKEPEDIKGSEDIKKPEDTKKLEEIVEPNNTKHQYTVKELSKLLNRSERRIQELAQEGKIPAHKVGRGWHFPKEEIDRWLSEKGNRTDNVRTHHRHSNEVVMTMTTAPQEEDARPPDESVEGITDESLNKEDSERVSD